ncbi:MAG: peptidoglycan-associated lipoprotein Pal [Agarilytica sp.]
MTKTIKSFLTLFALVGFLAACSSTDTSDDTSAADDAADTSIVDDTATDTSDMDADPLAGVDTVFYFEFDSSILSSEARAALMVHAEVIGQQNTSVRLEGHADERGSREYNMALGERRANAVRDFLVLQGVDSSLIETVSYGEERPAEIGSYDSAWSKNRRVELN